VRIPRFHIHIAIRAVFAKNRAVFAKKTHRRAQEKPLNTKDTEDTEDTQDTEDTEYLKEFTGFRCWNVLSIFP
jgi:hypothetical protein